MESLATTVERQLPYLRRYARAICGNQQVGDARVVACLEAALAGALGDARAPAEVRLALFRILHDVWPGSCAPDGADHLTPEAVENGDDSDAPDDVAERVARIAPRTRQALVLSVLEGFSLEDTAAILRMEPAEAASAQEQARHQMRAQSAARVLIIEDEPVIALDIATIVKSAAHSVVGMAATRQEAVAIARRERPDLVLADIQLADDSSGVDAVNDILRDYPVPVIFITAFPERLLTGERPEPAFLITKPFDPETLRVSIFQALCSADTAPANA